MIASKNYVVGFMIDTCGETPEVLLIRKTRPAWQAGKLNGVGGKVEPGEAPVDAMVREFEEETRQKVGRASWRHFVTLGGAENYDMKHPGRFRIDFFVCDQRIEWHPGMVAPTDEVPVVVPARDMWSQPVLPNLLWLVPMALSFVTRHPSGVDRAPGFAVEEWAAPGGAS